MLSDDAVALLQPPVFAVVTTLCDDGQPQSSVVWLRADADGVVFSTTPRDGEVRVVVRVTPTKVVAHVASQSAKRSS